MKVEQAAGHWPGLHPVRRLAGGNRNQVWLCESGTGAYVLRRSGRSRAGIEWELGLLGYLHDHGLPVPAPVPRATGNPQVEGWHVLEYIDGTVLHDPDDQRLEHALEAVHAHTQGWGQRPGGLGARELLVRDRGGDVDLSAMPADLVDRIRTAWAEAATSRSCVVHGDAGPGNAIITPAGDLVLIDWDEARVDDPLYDVGTSPQARRARLAWEIATCWRSEPAYASRLSRTL